MRIFLNLSFLFICSIIIGSPSVKDHVNHISSLIRSYPDSAFNLAIELRNDSEHNGNEYGLVQSNFILGYVERSRNNFGDAVIYYLEAIRYAEDASYESVVKNLISLNKNCGVIFGRFKAYDLAKEYYSKGLNYAIKSNNIKQIVSLKYNLSSVYLDQEDYDEGIKILISILPLVDQNSAKYFDILNRLSFAYLSSNNFEESLRYANLIINSASDASDELLTYAYHNTAVVKKENRLFDDSRQNFLKAIEVIRLSDSFEDSTALFNVFRDLGNFYFSFEKSDLAIESFSNAEKLIPHITQHPKFFELFKDQANLYYSLSEYELSKHYEDLYSKHLNEYLALQEQIRSTDQRYNMDLITKRYFAEVEKQERIASILFYSRLISGTLLFLLIATIAYNRYQKVKLRRSIEKELIALKIIE